MWFLFPAVGGQTVTQQTEDLIVSVAELPTVKAIDCSVKAVLYVKVSNLVGNPKTQNTGWEYLDGNI